MCGGTNWPKRGNKHTNWQGGMNGAAFVSGGFVPAALRGTHSDVAMHIVDWYGPVQKYNRHRYFHVFLKKTVLFEPVPLHLSRMPP